MRVFATLIAAGLGLAVLGGCEGGEREEAETEENERQDDDDD